MKYILTLIVASAIFAGCVKDTLTEPIIDESGKADMMYDITLLRDTSMERVGEAKMTLNITKTSGRNEEVTLTSPTLPDGMSVVFEPAVATPPFYSVMTITSTRVQVGDYKLKVQGASKSSGVKTVSAMVKILPYTNPARAFNDVFTESHQCSKSGADAFDVKIEPSETVNGRIMMKGFWGKTWTTAVYGDLNEAGKTISIPAQRYNGVEYKGIGTYNDNQLTINYTVQDTLENHPLVNESCQATISRK